MESNVRSYPRKLPLAIAKAQGCWVTDVEGTQYLDCLAGAGTLALGHNHPAVIQSIQDTLASGLPLHTLDLTTPLKDAFTEALLAYLPGGKEEYCLQFCGPSGADATEAAIKLAKTYTGRSSVISFSGGYHGMTHGSLSMTGNLSAKNAVNGLMPGVQFMPYPHEYRCPLGLGGEAGVDALTYFFENFIEDVESGVTKPAAVILEAIQGEGGVVTAPVKWLQKIREVTEKHNIVLILDEVQAGFARSGKMFAFEHADIVPDVVVMSKADKVDLDFPAQITIGGVGYPVVAANLTDAAGLRRVMPALSLSLLVPDATSVVVSEKGAIGGQKQKAISNQKQNKTIFAMHHHRKFCEILVSAGFVAVVCCMCRFATSEISV
jgi:diaminobutyrate-2-oxoglutarate transaminase